MTFLEQEEHLFARWIKHDEEWIYQENWPDMAGVSVEDAFVRDGLHFTGNETEKVSNGENTWRKMVPDGKQEDLWERAYLKPIFLCKDCNGYSEDLRLETGYANVKFYGRFYSNYLSLLYGLTNYNPVTKEFPAREVACDIDNFWEGEKGFFHAPVVRMNLKKIMGASKCPNHILKHYIDKDKQFITEQKDIYKGANVFICCNGSLYNNPIWKLLSDPKDGWFRDLEHYDKDQSQSIWYSKSHRVIVLWAYHMSCPGEDYYKYIPSLRQFLCEFEGFLV